MYELTLSDLKMLGHKRGTTAHLSNGELVFLRPNFATQKCQAYVAGKLKEVDLKLDYAPLYAQILTIQRKGQLIAKRQDLDNGESALFSIQKGEQA